MALDAINKHLAGKGAGTMTFDMFVKTYLGKAADNDFPAGMIIEGYERKGSWVKISATENRWVSANLVEVLI